MYYPQHDHKAPAVGSQSSLNRDIEIRLLMSPTKESSSRCYGTEL